MRNNHSSDRSIPLPSSIHYEVPLRILEQKTTFAVSHHAAQRALAHELVITLRKALSQQRRLEESCRQAGLNVDYQWSLEHPLQETVELQGTIEGAPEIS
ncbi:MAG: DUF5340 domain-containing protein [Prochlorothrix sp.]|nr:DUF5340 domain-containing protein [Prochlorothrix sp.]